MAIQSIELFISWHKDILVDECGRKSTATPEGINR